MGFKLKLPARNKARRARMALDDGSPDFTLAKLAGWCVTNMSRQEILSFIDSLRDLAAQAEDEDDDAPQAGDRAFHDSANIGIDHRPLGSPVNTSKAEAEFRKMFPDARPLVRG